jgi:hypothetical protein
MFKEEVAAMRGRDAFTNFYTKLEQSREYFQKFPHLAVRHHVSAGVLFAWIAPVSPDGILEMMPAHLGRYPNRHHSVMPPVAYKDHQPP